MTLTDHRPDTARGAESIPDVVARLRATFRSGRTRPLEWRDGQLEALERLLNKGWATVRWAETPTKRHARYYAITASGRKQLKEKQTHYQRVSAAIARVMRAN